MSDELSNLLEGYNFHTLAEIAAHSGLDVCDEKGKKLRKAKLVPLMRRQLFTGERVRASLAKLSEMDRAVLDRLLLRGGEADTSTFRQEVVRDGLATEQPAQKRRGDYWRESYGSNAPPRADSRLFNDVMARLTLHGLAFTKFPTVAYGSVTHKSNLIPGSVIYVPPAIRSFLPEPAQPSLEMDAAEIGELHATAPDIFLRDLLLYWLDLRQNEVTFIQAGTVGKRDLKRINNTLIEPDPRLAEATSETDTGRLFFLRVLLEDLELATPRGRRLVPKGSILQVPDFWSCSAAEQLSLCLSAWEESSRWNEVHDPSLANMADRRRGRSGLLNFLRTLPAGQWLSARLLLSRLSVTDPDFLIKDRNRVLSQRSGYIGGSWYGRNENMAEKLMQLERSFVDTALSGPLLWLGIVDVGMKEGQPVSFRITREGSLALGTTSPAAAPADQGRLIVQPNFQILTLGPVPLALLTRLEIFADRVKAERGAFEYHLSQDSVYRAQQAGYGTQAILRLLAEEAGVEVPQNVLRSLQEWRALHERIVFRDHVSLCQAASADMLDELLADEELAGHLSDRASPTVAMVKKGKAADVLVGLLERGILPAVSSERPDADVNVVFADEEGSLRLVHAVPSLYLQGRLDRLAEPSDGVYHITETSVGAALRHHFKDVPSLLQELKKLHRGSLPQRLVLRIKAWGHHFGDAALSSLTLLQVKDQDTLIELFADPEVAPYLSAFKPSARKALAVVDEEKLETLRELLAERGMKVSGGLK